MDFFTIAAAVVLLFIVGSVLGSIRMVPQNNAFIVERFGKF